MLSLYVCVFSTLCAALAFPDKLPQVLVQSQTAEVKKNDYGIVGGQTVDIKKYPYTVSIYTLTLDRLLGGGAIIGKFWIVCSAYGTMGFEAKDFRIRYGSSDAGIGGERTNATKYILHDSFSMDYPYDVALLKTSSPMKLGRKAKAVKLAKSLPKAGTVATVSGFGKTAGPSKSDMSLKAVDVKVLSKDECEKYHSSLVTSFCADSDGVGPCSSDIGDPLVYNKNLIGFYIGGDTCNYHGEPDLYTDISVLRKWILETIKENSNKEEMEGIFYDNDDE